MQEEFGGITVSMIEGQKEAAAVVEKLFEVAKPEAVYSEPVTAGEYTVITASEVKIGMGYGFGGGAGTSAEAAAVEVEDDDDALLEEGVAEETDVGFGGGGGGGGVSGSRPVAAISIGPEGVQVQPVVDATKIALAFITALGAMAMMASRMKEAGRILAGE
jgi:uncharacterized spore protein YtfJ